MDFLDMLGGAVPQKPEAKEPVNTPEPPAGTEGEAPKGSETTTEAPKHDFAWAEGIFDIEERTPETIRTAIEQERKSKAEEIELLKNLPKTQFANDTVRKFNAFVQATGNDSYSAFQKVESIKIGKDSSPQDLARAIVAKQVIENPDKANIEEALVSKLLRTLPEITEDSTEAEKQDYEVAVSELMEQAKSAEKGIKEILDKIAESEPKEPDLEGLKLKKGENRQKWLDIVDKGLPEMKLEIPKVETKDGKVTVLDEKMVDVKFDANQKDIYRSNFEAYLDYVGVPEPSKEVLEQAHNYAHERVLMQSLPMLLADAYAKGKSEQAKTESKEDVNPSAARTEVKVDKPTTLGPGRLVDAIG